MDAADALPRPPRARPGSTGIRAPGAPRSRRRDRPGARSAPRRGGGATTSCSWCPDPGPVPATSRWPSLVGAARGPGHPPAADRGPRPGRAGAVPRRGLRGPRSAAPAGPRPRGDPHAALPTGVKLRRARRGGLGAVLDVDGRAFDGFWRLDRPGLDDAIHATASARVRVAADRDGAVVGYVVTGRSADRGYVQRLAVDPTVRRAGIGAALVIDGLRWLRRRHTLSAVVNTQVANDGALALYRRLGFVLQPDGLIVLTLPLTDAGSTAPDAGGPGDPW